VVTVARASRHFSFDDAYAHFVARAAAIVRRHGRTVVVCICVCMDARHHLSLSTRARAHASLDA
jgi:hypothetical protein